MAVLRPVRSSLPRGAIFAVGILIALVCGIIWPFTKTPGFELLNKDSQMIVHFAPDILCHANLVLPGNRGVQSVAIDRMA